ncbi:MAG: hypothetical protein KatS3mg058_4761 [Roseiflexus sp.]|nr:MAG: hypothetical protein KatS3mg058_4761 [Roseiflexus sp.]
MNPVDVRRHITRILSCGLNPSLRTRKPRRGFHDLSKGCSPQCPGIPGYFLDLQQSPESSAVAGRVGG